MESNRHLKLNKHVYFVSRVCISYPLHNLNTIKTVTYLCDKRMELMLSYNSIDTILIDVMMSFCNSDFARAYNKFELLFHHFNLTWLLVRKREVSNITWSETRDDFRYLCSSFYEFIMALELLLITYITKFNCQDYNVFIDNSHDKLPGRVKGADERTVSGCETNSQS